MVRFVTILTNAPLQPTGQPMSERCGDCPECVDVCPVNAFTGRAFLEDEPREARYDARKCDRYFKVLEEMMGVAVCGMYLYVCPYGKGKSLLK